ncbi:MAG TPA: hypothetical protein VHR45_07975 [Thermoanaerobaculia bacterium]|nr:hypothetical protein [Thermoanaerobaculia bacterium]
MREQSSEPSSATTGVPDAPVVAHAAGASETAALGAGDLETIQFERADFGAQGAGAEELHCVRCKAELRGSYFDLNGQPACERCRYLVEETYRRGPGKAGLLRAAAAGLGAAAAGALLYYAVLALTGYQVGLIAIVVGWMVGKSVRWGSRGHGGWRYQGLAMFLTYMAIASTYLPLAVTAFEKQRAAASSGAAGGASAVAALAAAPAGERRPAPGAGRIALAILALLALAAAMPLLGGFHHPLGLLIMAFGVLQAWSLNKRPVLAITGPYQIRGAGVTGVPGVMAAPQP